MLIQLYCCQLFFYWWEMSIHQERTTHFFSSNFSPYLLDVYPLLVYLLSLFILICMESTCFNKFQPSFWFGKWWITSLVFQIPSNVIQKLRPLLSWLYGSWIYNYLCNQWLSPLTLWVRIPLGQSVLDTTLCDKVCQWLAIGRCFSLGTPVSSTNKTEPWYNWNIVESGIKHHNPKLNHPSNVVQKLHYE